MTSTQNQVATEFVALARLLRAGPTVEDCQRRIVRASVRALPACDHAALSVLSGGRLTTAAASDDVAARLDELQAETSAGPCLDALTDPGWEHHVDLERVSDPTDFQRRLRTETPVRSMVGFRLIDDGRKTGALNLASDRPHAFTDDSAAQAAVLAAFASAALLAAGANRRSDELRQGLDTSREIGIAIGILMASHHISADDAFAVLRRASQEMNRKLRDIAHELVHASHPADPA